MTKHNKNVIISYRVKTVTYHTIKNPTQQKTTKKKILNSPIQSQQTNTNKKEVTTMLANVSDVTYSFMLVFGGILYATISFIAFNLLLKLTKVTTKFFLKLNN